MPGPHYSRSPVRSTGAPTILYISPDDGHLYEERLDNPDAQKLELLYADVVLTPTQLCASESLVEVLLRAGQARLV
jgi:hypothetical protein